MNRKGLVIWFGCFVLAGTALCGQSNAEDLLTWVQGRFHRDCPADRPTPAAGIVMGCPVDPKVVAEMCAPWPPGPCPYFGQAMGATYFNYGYFGAHQHFTFSYRVGYYGDYVDRAYSWGY